MQTSFYVVYINVEFYAVDLRNRIPATPKKKKDFSNDDCVAAAEGRTSNNCSRLGRIWATAVAVYCDGRPTIGRAVR